jgi:FtsZ-interacting cell division protein ZipA
VLPVIIIVAVAVPLLVLAFVGVWRGRSAGEHPPAQDEATAAAEQAEYEDEFEKAEEYQAEWREEQHREHPDDRLY